MQLSYREKYLAQLLLVELTEEVTLVLVLIFASQQMIGFTTVDILCLSFTAIVPGRYIVSAKFESSFQENIKLDLPVAEHIRIRRTALLVLIKHIVHNTLFVLLTKVNRLERDAQFLGDDEGVIAIFQPGTLAADDYTVVMPVFHEQADYIIALLFQQIRCDAGVYATRHTYYYAFHNI